MELVKVRGAAMAEAAKSRPQAAFWNMLEHVGTLNSVELLSSGGLTEYFNLPVVELSFHLGSVRRCPRT